MLFGITSSDYEDPQTLERKLASWLRLAPLLAHTLHLHGRYGEAIATSGVCLRLAPDDLWNEARLRATLIGTPGVLSTDNGAPPPLLTLATSYALHNGHRVDLAIAACKAPLGLAQEQDTYSDEGQLRDTLRRDLVARIGSRFAAGLVVILADSLRSRNLRCTHFRRSTPTLASIRNSARQRIGLEFAL